LEGQQHVEDLRGLQVRGRVEQQRTDRHPAGLEVALELRAKRTDLVGPGERVEALIQAALGCCPVLVERVLVSDDIRAETTRALTARPVWKAHAAGGFLRHTCVTSLVGSGRSAEAARHLLGGAPFDLLAMGQLRHQVLGGGPHLGNQRAARIV
jgi:hypothetical protein